MTLTPKVGCDHKTPQTTLFSQIIGRFREFDLLTVHHPPIELVVHPLAPCVERGNHPSPATELFPFHRQTSASVLEP